MATTQMVAFPSGPDKGMDLRDFFATYALEGMLHNGAIPAMCGSHPDSSDGQNFADAAYHIADEMMVARQTIHN